MKLLLLGILIFLSVYGSDEEETRASIDLSEDDISVISYNPDENLNHLNNPQDESVVHNLQDEHDISILNESNLMSSLNDDTVIHLPQEDVVLDHVGGFEPNEENNDVNIYEENDDQVHSPVHEEDSCDCQPNLSQQNMVKVFMKIIAKWYKNFTNAVEVEMGCLSCVNQNDPLGPALDRILKRASEEAKKIARCQEIRKMKRDVERFYDNDIKVKARDCKDKFEDFYDNKLVPEIEQQAKDCKDKFEDFYDNKLVPKIEQQADNVREHFIPKVEKVADDVREEFKKQKPQIEKEFKKIEKAFKKIDVNDFKKLFKF